MKTKIINPYNWQYLRLCFALLVVLIGSSAASHGQDGTMKWAFSTGSWVDSSPALGMDGTVYVGSFDSNLYAINPDGAMEWAFPTGASIWSSPAIGTDGTLYVGSSDFGLYAINPEGGLKWSLLSDGPVLSSPAIGKNGTLYIGSDDRNLYAISPEGTMKWFFATGGLVQSSPTIGEDGTVYVGSDDGNLYAINGSSGGLLSDSPWPMFHHDLKHTGHSSSEDGSDDSSQIGVYRDGVWFLDYNGNQQFDDCEMDRCIGFGLPGDDPITGDWDGSGTTKIGVYRDGGWFLDYNGNKQFDDCETDRCIGFGRAGDVPVTGVWVRDNSSLIEFEVPEVLEPAVVGVPYTYSFCQQEPAVTLTSDLCGGPFDYSINPIGGEPPYHFTKDIGGGFPPFELQLNLNGLLTGTPTIAGPAISFSVCAIDLDGQQKCRETSLTVNPVESPPPPAIEFTVPASLEPATKDEPYSYSFCKQEPAVDDTSDLCGGPFDGSINPSGGESPYHFSLGTAGGFPPFGMILNLNGLLTGTPTAEGTSFFTVCAVDVAGTQVCRETSLKGNAVEPPPPPSEEVSITFESESCPVDRWSWGELISLSPETSGSVSGPVGTEFFASGLASADLICPAWSNCMRSESEPSTTGWMYKGFGVRNENKIEFEAISDFGSKSLTAYVICPPN